MTAVVDVQAPSRDWVRDAVCVETDPAVFFPGVGEDASAARTVCAACPVTAQCLAWALAMVEPHGVWGGLSWEERRPLIAGRRMPRAGRWAR